MTPTQVEPLITADALGAFLAIVLASIACWVVASWWADRRAARRELSSWAAALRSLQVVTRPSHPARTVEVDTDTEEG